MSTTDRGGDYRSPELFTPEMLALQDEAHEINDAYEINDIVDRTSARSREEGREAAEIDEFGIYSNDRFRNQGPKEVSQANQSGRPLGLVMADLDGLKAINDELGHSAGDEIINRARLVFQGMVAESEIPLTVGRVGGDEFAILVHGNENQTRIVAREFERRYQGYAADPENEKLKEKDITTSIGYANLSKNVSSFSELMRAADRRLYENKVGKLGELSRRDRLCLLAARGMVKLSSKKRLRDAPKYWRQMGVLD